MKKEYKILKPIIIAALGAAIGMGGTYYYYKDKIDFAERYALVAECENLVKKTDVKMPDNDTVNEALAEGFAKSFEDKYTFYADSNTDRDNLIAYFNTFPTAYGGGFELAYNDDDELYFKIVRIGSYAEENGIARNDVVVSINGLPTTGDDYKNVRELFGKDGTTCQLVLRRGDETVELVYTRHNVDMPEGENMSYELYGNTLYIDMRSVTSFMDLSFEDEDYDSVVFDFRNNSGGDGEMAASFCDNFLSEGLLTMHYNSGKTKKFKLNESEFDIKVPMVVLVNENTASAAEIMTALFKQFGGATIVGTNTYGKGIFQLEKQLSNGGYLHYTAGYFTVGDWECWQGKGIAPDYEVEMSSALIGTDKDIQLQKALELLG